MRHQNALSAFGPAQHTLGAHMHAQSPHRSLHGRRQRLQMGGDTNGGRHCWLVIITNFSAYIHMLKMPAQI